MTAWAPAWEEPSLRLLMMQRNEGELLRAWADFHAALVGKRRLTIFDNGSDDAGTLAVIEDLRARGIKVIDRPGRAAFGGKGDIFAAHDEADGWFIPMDCDEFLCGFDGDRPVSPAAALRELAGMEPHVRMLRIEGSLFNHPHLATGYPEVIRKAAVRAGTPLRLDVGFHCFDWGERRCLLDPALTAKVSIGFIHINIHNKPFTQLVQAARRKLDGRVEFTPEALAGYRGPGTHLAPYLLIDEQSYLASFRSRLHVHFGHVFAAVGLGVPYASASAAAMPAVAEVALPHAPAPIEA